MSDAPVIPPRAPDYNPLDDEAFREVVREFLAENYPPHLRFPPHRLHWAECKEWYFILAEKGWIAPGWPRQWGGMGLSPAKQIILIEEFERFGAARLPDHGIVMVGPLLLRYGTDAQRRFFLPRILSGEHIWCQGYSEPNAGSDLAALRTEAVREGEAWVITGQKIWTTLAQDANWMFLLARTDKTAKKQEGISFFLVPMTSPGIRVRPIVNLELHDEFCEVFLDQVRVPLDHLVGEVNQGWSMAKALLGFERIFLGSPRQAANALARLKALADHLGLADDPHFLRRYTEFRLDLADHRALYAVHVARLREGEALGAEVSMLKVHQSELFQRITAYMLEIAAEYGGLLEPIGGNRALHPGGLFIQSRPVSIYGGTNEIQRNIIAKNVLDLPG
jgi:alkylation response protein AidB-like acyl-CoA dehydrogenase